MSMCPRCRWFTVPDHFLYCLCASLCFFVVRCVVLSYQPGYSIFGSPLHHAIYMHSIDVINALIAAGADISEVHVRFIPRLAVYRPSQVPVLECCISLAHFCNLRFLVLPFILTFFYPRFRPSRPSVCQSSIQGQQGSAMLVFVCALEVCLHRQCVIYYDVYVSPCSLVHRS
jgi:hypothetical protein